MCSVDVDSFAAYLFFNYQLNPTSFLCTAEIYSREKKEKGKEDYKKYKKKKKRERKKEEGGI